MKPILYVLLLGLIPWTLFSQTQEELIEIDYLKTQKVGLWKLELIQKKSLIQSSGLEYYIRFTGAYWATGAAMPNLSTGSNPAVKERETGVIEFSEIDGLIRYIGIMEKKYLPYAYGHNKEIFWKSKSGVEIGMFYNQKKKSWQAFLNPDRSTFERGVLSTKELLEFRDFLVSAKEELESAAN